ncbi:MAG TPA: DNA polymerase III subunit gamma/tau [Candidatus Paceibacterota bacterium]|nr:DNA polymerase III subunit gamma/tau [Candidatus Paceibacterota bacterium]
MLYRQYRPRTWDQVIGQEHVVRTLQGALKADRVGHAYLFAGPRGTGKTTLARILAKAVNCTDTKKHPCDACHSCKAIAQGASLDVVEIDAASNRGIDDVRGLKETAGTAPASSPKKVFIVDEVHMLSKDAFNALLKLLEEPPAHAMFILATTEPHKVLPTVLSRVQRFDFRKLTQKEIVGKLAFIAKAEKLEAQPAALAAIAAAADGAFRDAEVMLTKLAARTGGSAITEDTVREVLGLVPIGWHARLAGFIAAGDRAGALRFIQEAVQGGVDLDHFTKGFLECLRQVMILKIDPAILTADGLSDAHMDALSGLAGTMDGRLLVRTIQSFTEARNRLRSAPVASLPLELAIIELTEGA